MNPKLPSVPARVKRLGARPERRAVVVCAAVAVALAFWQPTVFSSYGVILQTAVEALLVACGLTVVLIQGEIDLQRGSHARPIWCPCS